MTPCHAGISCGCCSPSKRGPDLQAPTREKFVPSPAEPDLARALVAVDPCGNYLATACGCKVSLCSIRCLKATTIKAADGHFLSPPVLSWTPPTSVAAGKVHPEVAALPAFPQVCLMRTRACGCEVHRICSRNGKYQWNAAHLLSTWDMGGEGTRSLASHDNIHGHPLSFPLRRQGSSIELPEAEQGLPIRALAFDEQGKRLLIAGDNKACCVWDLEHRTLILKT